MNNDIIQRVKELFGLEGFELSNIPGHLCGRNTVYICSKNGEKRYVLRLSDLDDRSGDEYKAETAFVHFLAQGGAPVADVFPSVNGQLVECISDGTQNIYACLFAYAKGMTMYENGYRYRKGAPIEEYFRNVGKTLGAIHKLSKEYETKTGRISYFDKYNMDFISSVIPDTDGKLLEAIAKRLDRFRELPKDKSTYGMVHFDYGDSNYHVDMNSGDITVFDFDNCMYCWYMFDLANMWIQGIGWYRGEKDPDVRMKLMGHYFDTCLEGYRSETDVSDESLSLLPLFIDMVVIENIVDEYECKARGEEYSQEYIDIAAGCLINDIPYYGVGIKWE